MQILKASAFLWLIPAWFSKGKGGTTSWRSEGPKGLTLDDNLAGGCWWFQSLVLWVYRMMCWYVYLYICYFKPVDGTLDTCDAVPRSKSIYVVFQGLYPNFQVMTRDLCNHNPVSTGWYIRGKGWKCNLEYTLLVPKPTVHLLVESYAKAMRSNMFLECSAQAPFPSHIIIYSSSKLQRITESMSVMNCIESLK